MGRRERKKAATRARIIDEAAALFRANGYQSTTIADITRAADLAPRTFYSYFDAKVDVALAQFEELAKHHYEAMVARPAGETPVEMAEGAMVELAQLGYVTSERLRDEDGFPFPSIASAVVLSETEPEVAGRVFQVLMGFQSRMTELFRQRLGYPVGAIEPRIIAASMSATWFVAIYGFADMCASEPDPPSLDELGLTSMRAYSQGLERLWKGRLGGTP